MSRFWSWCWKGSRGAHRLHQCFLLPLVRLPAKHGSALGEPQHPAHTSPARAEHAVEPADEEASHAEFSRGLEAVADRGPHGPVRAGTILDHLVVVPSPLSWNAEEPARSATAVHEEFRGPPSPGSFRRALWARAALAGSTGRRTKRLPGLARGADARPSPQECPPSAPGSRCRERCRLRPCGTGDRHVDRPRRVRARESRGPGSVPAERIPWRALEALLRASRPQHR